MKILDNPRYSISAESDDNLQKASQEMNKFLEDVWFTVGDTTFNRSGLRTATDKLIDFLKKKGYYFEVRGATNKIHYKENDYAN